MAITSKPQPQTEKPQTQPEKSPPDLSAFFTDSPREGGTGNGIRYAEELEGVSGQRLAEYLGTLQVRGRHLPVGHCIRVVRHLGYKGQKEDSLKMRIRNGHTDRRLTRYGEVKTAEYFKPCRKHHDAIVGAIIATAKSN